MLLTSLFTVAVAAVGVSAQSATSTYVEPEVPTGTPVVGNYDGPLRPQIHFSPPTMFMNDPNGMFLDNEGVYHLYYQYNPTDIVAGNQHWGHATSRDLYHWVNQPIALFPGNETQAVFSGSCVVDTNNTTGFFPDQDNGVVAMYTLNTPFDQSQDLAFSYDSGYTWVKYEGNPVITIGSIQFRDPKVIWYEPTQKWVMTITYSQEFAVGIFSSPNLIDWTEESNFSYHGLLGLQWEVPNLIEIPVEGGDGEHETMWLMLISINPGAPLGGSITQFSPGDFNGTHFMPVDSAARIADFGKDNYAGGFFYGTPADERPISIAWASNWQYAQSNPTGPLEGWRSAMSLPRENYLTFATRIGYVLNSYPYDLSPVFPEEPLAADGDVGNGTIRVDFSDLESKTIYFEVNITSFPEENPSGTANFTFFSSVSGESLNGGQYLSGDNPFWLNRGMLNGFEDPFFTDKFSTNIPYDPDTSAFTITGVLDRSIFEVFLQGGKHSATITFFPEEPLDTMVFSTAELPDGVGVSVSVWGLDSAWEQYKDADGTVVGNVTTGGQDGMGTDSGDMDSGDTDTGDMDSDDLDSGDTDTGDMDSDVYDSGNTDTGDAGSDDQDSGDMNAGDAESDSYDSGDPVIVDADSVDLHSGDTDTGDAVIVDADSDDHDSGDTDTGDAVTGDAESEEMLDSEDPPDRNGDSSGYKRKIKRGPLRSRINKRLF